MAYFPLHESGFTDLGGPNRWQAGQIQAFPWKLWGIGSNGLCGGLVASKLSAHCFDTFFPLLHVKRSVAKNFDSEIFRG